MDSRSGAMSATALSAKPALHANHRHQIAIIGGGNAGISVAARLRRALKDSDVAIIEPSETHFYQPLWTLVGGGVVPKEKTIRREQDLIPNGVTWIKNRATAIDPDANRVTLANGETVEYDYLVVAAGIETHWNGIDGLAEHVGSSGIVSNYDYNHAEATWQAIKNFKGGRAIFTMPPPPIKCAGAPQKIMYLADDAFRKNGVRAGSKLIYAAATPGIFGVKTYAKTLNRVIERKGIETRFQHNLTALRPESKEAVFVNDDDEEVVLEYDLIHVTPPQRPPAIVRESALADDAGWLKVDKHTLRNPDHPNVFSIGDASSLPTSKTGAAIRKQAPVLVGNLVKQICGKGNDESYDGYTACPLVTGYGKLVMAEFDYDLEPAQTFPFDQSKERRSMYELKRRGLPALYWNGILKGRA